MNYENMTEEELKKLFADVEEELEELVIERQLTLGGTGVHIGVAEVQRIRDSIEKSEKKALEKKESILKALGLPSKKNQ